jgi:hypothetical protein
MKRNASRNEKIMYSNARLTRVAGKNVMKQKIPIIVKRYQVIVIVSCRKNQVYTC